MKYHALTTHEALGAGSAGPGKTRCLMMEPFAQIAVEHQRCQDPQHQYPLKWGESVGWALYLRRISPSLLQTITHCQMLFKRIDPGVEWIASQSLFKFRSGYRYQFGHCSNPNDYLQYYSNEYTIIMFDELVEFLEEQYDQITSRCRSVDPVLSQMLKVRAMSNPLRNEEESRGIVTRDPAWVRRRFVDPAPQGGKILRKKNIREDGTIAYRTRIYLPARLYDNPNKEFVRQYEETLLDKPTHIRKALLDGDWYSVRGAFFGDDWNERLHVHEPFDIPKHWRHFRGMDWGYKSPGCVLWGAIDDDETLWIHRELTFQGMIDVHVARRIKEIEQELGLWQGKRSRITGPADTQLWERRGDSGKSKAEAMSGEGVEWVPADKASKSSNSQRFLTRLRDHRHGTMTPGIVFFSTCHRCITTIPSIGSDPHDSESPADGGEDHWLDAVLYMCAFASHGSIGIPMLKDEDEKVDYDGESVRKKDKTGGYGYGIRY